MMNSIYGQNENPNLQTGMIPYAAPMLGMGAGGDSLFQIAWRGKWFILISALLGLGGAYGYLRTLKPEYTSTSRILVSIPDSRLPSDVPAPVVSKPNLATQASMMTSGAIVSAALSDPNVLAASADIGSRPQDLARKLSARVGKDDIINVTASSESREGAAAIVNAVVRAYIRWHGVNKQVSTADFLTDLNAQLERLSGELRKARQEVTNFEQRHPAVVESARGGIVSKTLDTLKQELVNARMYAIQQSSFYNRLNTMKEDPNRFRQYVYSQQNLMGMTIEDGEQSRLTDELEKIRLQLQQFLAGGPVQKSQITLLQNREKELVRRISEFEQEFVQKHIDVAKALSDSAVDRDAQLTKLYEDELAKIQELGKDNAEYALLLSECDILERQCNSYTEQIRKIPPDTSRGGVSIYVLERAVPPTEPSSQTARIMGMGLLLGLAVGGGLAFLRDWRDQTVRSADEITAILGVPILGAVPTIPRRGILRRGPRVRLALHSRESEAYRSIRTALFFGAVRDEAKTLLVTSPGPLEGKTTLVSNLAITMAHAGQKTLIVDADLRKPMQHRVFAKGGHGKGLVDVLAGTVTLEEAVRPTDVEGLDVLESGHAISNPSELLGSDAFWAMFEQLKGRYDRILVDSPPVGVVADAQILAARCGLTLLVLRAQRSSRVVTQRARDALSTVSAKVVGAVVNDVRKGDTRYSHYGSGAYSYYHGSRNSPARNAALKELPAGAGPQSEDEAPAPEKKQ